MTSSRTVVFQAPLNIPYSGVKQRPVFERRTDIYRKWTFCSLHKALILNKFLGKSSLQELAQFGERRFAEREVGSLNMQGL